MSLAGFLSIRVPTKVGEVELDASVSEDHGASASVTRHPVETSDGTLSTVSDNIHVDPLTVQIEGIVTNHPPMWPGTFDHSGTRDRQAHLQLLSILRTGTLITIKTTLYEYTDMAIERIQVKRDKDRGNALFVTLSAAQVSLVTLEETSVSSGQRPVAQSTKSGGKQAATPADANTQTSSTSLLTKIKSLIGG